MPATLVVARATGLVKGFDVEVKATENGRAEGWIPRLG